MNGTKDDLPFLVPDSRIFLGLLVHLSFKKFFATGSVAHVRVLGKNAQNLSGSYAIAKRLIFSLGDHLMCVRLIFLLLM